jgi:TANFOR domain-containing protein
MKNLIYRCGIVVILMLAAISLWSQNFPVQATIQVTPPYSLYLEDYTLESNRLSLMVFFKDFNRPEYRVRFRFSIEGNGISIATSPNYLPPPVILQGGVPLALSGPELADYLNPFNLVFSGISRQEFQKTGRLPEGPYRICFEVLDYNLGVPVSNQGCNIAWLVLNDPPLVNLPQNNTKMRATDPQNIVFQWTPRHTASPNAAFSTEYYFRMVEVWPADRNPFDAINTSTPFFETVTNQNVLLYSLAEPPLVPGRRYAFRILARQSDGATGRDLFKNNGYSEVFTFTYGDECKAPVNIQTASPDSRRIKINWEGLPGHTQYAVQYKETNTSMEWRQENTFLTALTLSSLKPGVRYEIQVGGRCETIPGAYSAVLTQQTLQSAESTFECGRAPVAFNLDNLTPLASLALGDIIISGDFEVEITEVVGSNGTFTGKGKVAVPFLNYIKVPVTFESISVNTDKRVVKGNIVVDVTALQG